MSVAICIALEIIKMNSNDPFTHQDVVSSVIFSAGNLYSLVIAEASKGSRSLRNTDISWSKKIWLVLHIIKEDNIKNKVQTNPSNTYQRTINKDWTILLPSFFQMGVQGLF